MRSLRMKSTAAGPTGCKMAGQVYRVSAEEGQPLVDGNAAEWVDPPLVAAPAIEAAMMPARETATRPRPAKRRGK